MVKRKNKSSFARLDLSEKIFKIGNGVLLIILALLVIYPIWYIIISSISQPVLFDIASTKNPLILIPQGFTLDYIVEHFQNSDIWRAYGNTFIYTFGGVGLSMVLSILAAYVMSIKFKGNKLISIIVTLTIWFRPGMIATYINIDNLGLMGSRWGLILPFAFSGFNVILLTMGFKGIHQDILEAAEIDGANHFQKLWHVVIPNALPSITTVALFYAIERWNGYFWAEVVLLDDTLYPLQVLVKKMLNSGGDSASLFEGLVSAYALIVIAVVPVLIVFPFIQKYFKKGIMEGSVK
ncbi:carbohydrate ABC transporter permease [Acholeplasma granularum]|uniref:carbohydrate ABC transporter permease n=1 Tax=Acholeplasma granularum TaxID=264635 RepID=UPI0004714E90|nr:carbohydrate ABC transporter permease [Acholeplasma granularum]